MHCIWNYSSVNIIIMKRVCIVILTVLSAFSANAQVLKKLQKKVERKVEQRVERKTDRAIDKGLDKVEEEIDGTAKKSGNKSGPASGGKETGTTDAGAPAAGKVFSAQSKYDFVPGEKVIALEDFSQDAVGDFPGKWNTDASGEIVQLGGSDQHWLALTSKGAFTPEFITSIPGNATIEFDLAVSPDYSYYDAPLFVSIAQAEGTNGFTAWQHFGRGRKTGTYFTLHPVDAGNKHNAGRTEIQVWENGKKIMENKRSGSPGFSRSEHTVHVSVWRQQQRLRVYVGEHKIWDLPRAFVANGKYNSLVFSKHNSKDGNHYYITNIRLAAGDPDTRHKLLNEGKFSTTGIYFNSGSAVIKPESHGVIKEIAEVLKENGSLKVRITGHTDSDGSSDLNMKLSAQRAAAVKAYLGKQFGIAAARMETDGKGATAPVADNATAEGKAQNRRVEFTRL